MSSRIAFIAVQAAPNSETQKYYALVVGSDITGSNWLFARYNLADIQEKLKETDFDPFYSSDDVQRIVPMSDDFGDADCELTSAEISEHGEALVLEDSQLLPFRDIVQVVFFRAGYSPFADPEDGQEGLHDPYARVECCRAVDNNGRKEPLSPLETPNHGTYTVGSRLELYAQKNHDKSPVRKLSSFRLIMDIPMAINVHCLAMQDVEFGDEYDTRARIVLQRSKRNPDDLLWAKEKTKSFAKWEGVFCSRIGLGVTVKPYKQDQDHSRIIKYYNNVSLQELATKEPRPERLITNTVYPQGCAEIDPEYGKFQKYRLWSPFLSQMGLLNRQFTTNKQKVSREVGFRPVKKVNDSAYILALRFELDINNLTNTTIFSHEKMAGLLPRDLSEALGSRRLLLAQEQRIGDIHAALDPEQPVYWTLTVRPKDGTTDGNRIVDKVVSQANKDAGLIHSSLRTVRDGRPLSFVPKINGIPVDCPFPWHAVGLIKNTTGHQRSAPYYDNTPNGFDTCPEFRFISFEPRYSLDYWNWNNPSELTCELNAAFPCLLREDREPVSGRLILRAPRAIDAVSKEGATCMADPGSQPAVTELDYDTLQSTPAGIRFSLECVELDDNTTVTLGALSLRFGKWSNDRPKEPCTVLLGPIAGDPQGSGSLRNTFLQMRLNLPVGDVQPASQESSPSGSADFADASDLLLAGGDLPEDTSLLLPLGGVSNSGVSAYVLQSTETIMRHRNQHLELSLRATNEAGAKDPAGNSSATRRLLIIDPSPFRVAAVDYKSLQSQSGDASNQVATWTNEGDLVWSVLDETQSVSLTLPPQVIGEAMEKNVFVGEGASDGLPMDIQPEQAAAARFGSMTCLKLDPTYAETRFREPGWNLKRILGYADQRLPGSRVREMRTELVYGMVGRIAAQDVWICELAGILGEPASFFVGEHGLSQDKLFLKNYHELVRCVLDAEKKRLAVDKVWRNSADDDVLDQGVTFHIRTRDAKGKKGPETPLRWPVPGELPANLNDNLRDTFSTSQNDSESFPGGLSWAFDSANVLMSVYNKPVSDSALMSRLFFSAHGGYGNQRGVFDNRRTIIETETTQGRVHRYRLERVGRIACLWHPAKHVIVYERTVVPSAQFYNTASKRQDEHAGRPILRKVEEYVEILKPLRHYPEQGNAINESGVLLGAEFKSLKILVDSNWGRDVRCDGWEVPLWSTAEAADIYPKPQVCCILANAEGVEHIKEIDEPEKLYFYTSTIADENDDTDSWAPVRDVDYCDLPLPKTGKAAGNAVLADVMLSSEPEHVPGYERFTIALVPDKESIALTHGRFQDGPVAAIRNLTIARAIGQSHNDIQQFGDAVAQQAADIRAEVDQQVASILQTLESLEPGENAAETLRSACENLDADAFAKKIRGLLENTPRPSSIPTDCAQLKKAARAQLTGQWERVAQSSLDILNTGFELVEERLNEADHLAAQGVYNFKEVSKQIESVVANCPDEPIYCQHAVDTAESLKKSCDILIKHLNQGIDKEKIEVFRSRLGKLQEDLTGDVSELSKTILTGVQGLHGLLNGNFSAFPSKLQQLRNDIATKCDEITENISNWNLIADRVKQCSDKITTMQQRLRLHAQKESSAIAKIIILRIEKPLNGCQQLISSINKGLSPEDIRIRVTQIRTILEKLELTTNKLLQRCDKTASGISKFTVLLNNCTKTHTNQLASFVDSFTIDTDALFRSIYDDFGKIEALKGQVDAIIEHLISAIDNEKIDTTVIEACKALENDINTVIIFCTYLENYLTKNNNLTLANAKNEFLAKKKDSTAAFAVALENIKSELYLPGEGVIDTVEQSIADCCQDWELLYSNLLKYNDKFKTSILDALDLPALKEDLIRTAEAIKADAADLVAFKDKAAKRLGEAARRAEANVRNLSSVFQETVRDLEKSDLYMSGKRSLGVYQKGDTALHTLRALGDPPKTDSLGFNRPEVAYVFDQADKLGINMTPAVALANRAADQVDAANKAGKAVGELLDAFGVRLPTCKLTDQLIPDSLEGLDLRDLLPDMAGIDFKGLLANAKFPDLVDSKAVKIRHGFDKSEKRAWMEATIDVPFTTSLEVFNFGPVAMFLDKARFSSYARISTSLSGASQEEMNGSIKGDWRIAISSMDILTFVQTELAFDKSGKLDFRISPDKIRLAEVLSVITDMLQSVSTSEGLTVEPLLHGGAPSGVAAALNLVMPPIQTGAFGISDLSLHMLFGIAAIPRFEIVSELTLGTRMAPFTLNVWILNGGGYLIQRISYLPSSKQGALSYSLEVALAAGIGAAFSSGGISGGVFLQLGCSFTFHVSSSHADDQSTIEIFLLIRGNVDVVGLITASIALRLAMSYDGSIMKGSGELRFSIKVSFFYTCNVTQSVEQTFAGSEKNSGEAVDSYC